MAADKTLRPSPRAGQTAASPRLAPLYRRLPSGPHRLDRDEVRRHQRMRIHGAMVEAVAASGFQGTSVREVIALAGVSRRSFYEQFANKQECLLATFDLLAGNTVRRAREAYIASDGLLEDRLHGALGVLAQTIVENGKAAGLVIVETQTAGLPGVMRLRQATATCESMLCRGYARAARALPLPVVRGIAGGLHAAMSACVRGERNLRAAELTEEMLRWALGFQTPRAPNMAELISHRARRSMRNGLPARAERRAASAPGTSERGRLMEHALRLATVEELREMSAPRIADEADVSIDAFFEIFETMEACYLEALDMLAGELLRVTGEAGAINDWPRGVRRAIGALMLYLGERPHYARTIAAEALAAGPAAVERNVELARALATLLTEGATGEPPGRLTVEAVGGAIWNTVRCQVASGRVQLLPAFSDYLSFVVLAPFIGADGAAAVVSEERTSGV